MRITLDDKELFDEQFLEIEAGGRQRAKIEKSIAGLDGMISIDLGCRGQKIKQRGQLRTGSWKQMDKQICEICAFIDGKSHTLKTSKGQEFSDVRMDAFKVVEKSESGCGVVVSYEVDYMQLKV